jgi:DNA-binding MarR family transcriptional regulator
MLEIVRGVNARRVQLGTDQTTEYVSETRGTFSNSLTPLLQPHPSPDRPPSENLETLSQLIGAVSNELEQTVDQTDSLSTISLVTRIAKMVLRATDEHFAKLGISQTKLTVLIYLSEEPDLSASPSTLATHCDISRAAMTGLLDGLEQEGFVERAGHPSDRRALTIRLTPKGQQFLRRVLPQDRYRLSELMMILDEVEREKLIDLANKVIKLSSLSEP